MEKSLTHRITEITKRDIIDFLQAEGIDWAGRLTEPDFLARLYDLATLESHDHRYHDAYGDIWQHRVNNEDWDSNWVFSDGRFALEKGEDEQFLRFLCEMLHPIVRSDRQEVVKLVQAFNEYLKPDGYQLVERTQLSGRPVYAAKLTYSQNESIQKRNAEISQRLNADYVIKQITIMEGSIDTSPHVAIGIAKELVETCCLSILDSKKVTADKSWDLPKLMKTTAAALQLTPDSVPDEKKAATTIRQILGSLASVVQGLSELRNTYGSGHGKNHRFSGLGSRHAKLAVGAASTLSIFLLETNETK